MNPPNGQQNDGHRGSHLNCPAESGCAPQQRELFSIVQMIVGRNVWARIRARLMNVRANRGICSVARGNSGLVPKEIADFFAALTAMSEVRVKHLLIRFV